MFMPEKIRTSPASPPVIHRKNQAALVLEDDELPDDELPEDELLDEESFEVDDFEDSDEPPELDEDDSVFAGAGLLPDERLSVR
jgi:hypothetical protein